MSCVCYLFEAHSIQSWIFAGGRLRDAVGASALLDRVCNWGEADLFAEALDAVTLTTRPEIARRAGGGLCVYHQNRTELARLRAVFTLKVRDAAPDLPFADAIGAGQNHAEAFEAARAALTGARNVPAPDPLRAGPFVLPTPRTGAPASFREKPEKGGEILDAGLAAKRAQPRSTRSGIERQFDPVDDETAYRFPVELSEQVVRRTARGKDNPPFPFLGENGYIGLLHADGNGMGAILQRLGEALAATDALGYAEGFRIFSKTLADATVAAVHVAMTELEPSPDGIWPIRPLILGGDDLSAILRGDGAIRFAASFLRAFEDKTESAFEGLCSGEAGEFWKQQLPPRLSAGAGIVFVKSNQPFAQAYELAESLAKAAKDCAKDWRKSALGENSEDFDAPPPPATIAFHRISTARIPARWDQVLHDELSGTFDEVQTFLTMNPYVVSTKSANLATGAPRIERLEHLCRTLFDRDVARGPARSLTPEFLSGTWRRDWDRMLKMARQRNPVSAARFVEALEALGCVDGPFATNQGVWRTPVLDALSWVAVARDRSERRRKAEPADATG